METFLILGMAFRALIMLIGIPGNTLIVIVYVRKRLKSSTDIFILALAIADLSVCIVLPLKIYSSYNQNNYTNSELCKLTHYLSLIGTFLSMFLTVFITVDRYFAVCKPLKRFVTPSRARNTVVGCLLLSAAIGSVALVSAGIKQYGIVSTCSISASHGNIIHNYSFLIMGLYLVSLLIIGVLYTSIYKALRKKSQTFRQWSNRYRATPQNAIGASTNPRLNKLQSDKKTILKSKSTFNPFRKANFSLVLRNSRIEPQDPCVAWESGASLPDSTGEEDQRINAVDGKQDPPPFTIQLQDRSVKDEKSLIQQISEQLSSGSQTGQGTSESTEPTISVLLRSRPDPAPKSFQQLCLRAETRGLELGANRAQLNNYRARMKTNNRISKMIFLATVIFFMTWVPLLVFQCLPSWLIMALFTRSKAGFTIVYMLTLTLNVNHAINPIVYSFVNVRFRRECKATFAWMKRMLMTR